MILTDNETKVDLLNYEAIATTIVELLRHRPEQPMTIGVHGDWGAGKSSVLEMIEAGMAKDSKALCLKFNGWRFQGFEDAKIALIEGIVTGLLDKRPMLTKATQEVKEVFKRIDWLKVAKKAGGLALTAHTGIPMPGQFGDLVHAVQALIPDSLKEKKESAGSDKETKGFLKPKSESKRAPKEIEEFRKAFDKLLKAADIDQLVVLIDDLDRCLPDTAIETLEAVRLFVFTARTAFVVAADEAMIEYAVRKHFPDLPDTTGPMTYSRNYLEKLIQVPFRIPALGDIETRIYVTLLLAGTVLGENDPAFNSLIAAARERLKRPWTSAPFDSAAAKLVLGDKFDSVQGELFLSEQIGPTLASGTSGNPRQIKRFLNAMILRQRTAQARGFGDEVKLPVLAKLMLAERFLPGFFDQIGSAAASSADGQCPDIAHLEALSPQVKADSAIENAFPAETGKPTFQPTNRLREWLSSAAIRSWAQVQPPVGESDLRPYLFVAKDRKDYFGAATVLGHLANVAEKLLGPRITVQPLEPSLRKLALPEALQIFDAVRGRIVGTDSFDTEPNGAAGMAVLVKAHPSLQSALLNFLENMPVQRLGPWVCKGWEGVIKDSDAGQRFDRLLGKWAKEGTPMLKGAAQAVLKTRQKLN
ncbi:MAG: Qat anti-phage system ATPase QatA [Bryobacteraceae bacterium]